MPLRSMLASRTRHRVSPYLVVLLLLALLSSSTEGRQQQGQQRARPVKRSYDTHAYYVLELEEGSSVADAQGVARLLGAEFVEQVGELRDHWLLKAQHDVVTPGLERRDGQERDTVMQKYYDLVTRSDSWHDSRSVNQHLASPHGLLHAVRSTHDVPVKIRGLDKQVVKKRVKRQLQPEHLLGRDGGRIPRSPARPPKGPEVVSQYLRGIADRFSIADPLFPKQWHLANDRIQENTINVTGVWEQGVTGKGIRVAIVDDGLDMHSDDLKENFFADGSWDYNDHTDLPEPRLSDDQHGTRCAGEIAAVKNDVCGMGVAYEAQVAGIRILSASISDADEASALNFGYQENDIYSCSWGPPDDGRSMEAPSALIYKSMLNGVQNGRDGKGSVFVFASGNGGAVDDQCNFDGYTNSIFSITISAIDRKGMHPYYSEGCSANMVVTYSSGSGDNIHTTDVGKNKCTDHHGGTSAAAPIAAGIFALALQVRPELTWRDMQHIAVRSAIQVNVNDPDWQTTHAGRPYNHKYGYGKLDAYRIVEMARSFEQVKPQAWYTVPVINVGDALMTKEGAASSVEITSDNLKEANLEKLEHITVTVNAGHERRGNIEVWLESPNGIKSILARPRRFDDDPNGYEDWTFMSVKHWDENPLGKWTLTMLDRQKNGKNGTFIDWTMTLWGSAIDATIATPYKMPQQDQVILPQPPHHASESNNVTLITTEIVQDGSTMLTTITSEVSQHPHSKTTKSYARPTAHLPDDHAEQTGESDHPLEGLPTATSEPAQAPISVSPSDSWELPSSSAIPAESEEDNEDYSYLGPWSKLVDSQTWLFVAAGSVIIFLGGAIAYLLLRRSQQRRARDGGSGFRGLFGGYSTVSGRDDDGHPMSSLERGGRATGGAGRTKALYDAFAISDSSEDEEEADPLVERRVDDRYMSSFLEDDDARSPGPSPAASRIHLASTSNTPYRDDDDSDTENPQK